MPVDGSAVGTLFRVHKSFLPPTRAPSAHNAGARHRPCARSTTERLACASLARPMDWPPSRPAQAAHTALDQSQRATDVVGIGARRSAVPCARRLADVAERARGARAARLDRLVAQDASLRARRAALEQPSTAETLRGSRAQLSRRRRVATCLTGRERELARFRSSLVRVLHGIADMGPAGAHVFAVQPDDDDWVNVRQILRQPGFAGATTIERQRAHNLSAPATFRPRNAAHGFMIEIGDCAHCQDMIDAYGSTATARPTDGSSTPAPPPQRARLTVPCGRLGAPKGEASPFASPALPPAPACASGARSQPPPMPDLFPPALDHSGTRRSVACSLTWSFGCVLISLGRSRLRCLRALCSSVGTYTSLGCRNAMATTTSSLWVRESHIYTPRQNP